MNTKCDELFSTKNDIIKLCLNPDVEFVTIFKEDGTCVLECSEPQNCLVFKDLEDGHYLVVVNMKGGTYCTNISEKTTLLPVFKQEEQFQII